VSTSVAIMPVVVMLLFLVVQVCLWYYGRVVAYGAAQHGLEAARAYDGDARLGEDFVRQFLRQSGGVEVESITVERTRDRATVVIEGAVLDVLPFVDPHITVRREARIEAPPG
jgi:TadE-like protein